MTHPGSADALHDKTALDVVLLEILVRVMEKTERPHTATVIRQGGEVSSIGQGTCLIAMRLAYDAALSADAALSQQAVETVTVPRTPTKAMIRAVHGAKIHLNITDEGWKQAYEVMIDAALSQSVGEDELLANLHKPFDPLTLTERTALSQQGMVEQPTVEMLQAGEKAYEAVIWNNSRSHPAKGWLEIPRQIWLAMYAAAHQAQERLAGSGRDAVTSGFHAAWGYAKNHPEKCSEGYSKAAFSHVQFWLDQLPAADVPQAQVTGDHAMNALRAIAYMECYTREGEEEPHLVMMKIAEQALRALASHSAGAEEGK